MNKQQTAVEWLIEQLQKTRDWQRVINEANQSSTSVRDVIKEAKEMEKKQKYKFADEYCNALYSGCPLTPEDYDLTYGGNK
jgi:hypothetical protein